MISVRPADRDEIARVMFDPEIWDRTTSDKDHRKEHYDLRKANMDGWTFLGGFVDGKIAALFIVKNEQLHYWVLREYRKHAREILTEAFMQWPKSVWCEIPSLYRSVINFAVKFGFVETEIKKDAYVKNRKPYDMHVLRYTWAGY